MVNHTHASVLSSAGTSPRSISEGEILPHILHVQVRILISTKEVYQTDHLKTHTIKYSDDLVLY